MLTRRKDRGKKFELNSESLEFKIDFMSKVRQQKIDENIEKKHFIKALSLDTLLFHRS